MNWTNFFIILIGVPFGMLMLWGWLWICMGLEGRIGEKAAIAFALGTIILVLATIVGLCG